MLERELYGSILSIRQAARASALEFSRDVFGLGLQESGISGYVIDTHKARQIAASVVEQAKDAKASGGPLIKRVEQSLVRVAVTENAAAYNDEHRLAVSAKAERLGLVEVWDAELDKRTCEHCYELDGSIADGGMFPGGQVPGHVHPHCRCTSHFIRRTFLH